MLVQAAQLQAISELGLQDDVDYIELLWLPRHIRVRVWYKSGSNKDRTHGNYGIDHEGVVSEVSEASAMRET